MKVTTICYLEDGGKVLMLYRNKKVNDVHEGKWVGVGGKFEVQESPEDCILREFREETGLTLQKPQLKGVITFPLFRDNEDWLMFLYTCRSYTGALSPSNEGTLRWIDKARLLELNMWEGDLLFLRWMEQPGFFSAKIVYDQGRLASHSVVFYGG